MVFPIAGGTQDTSYEIENSLRFNDDDTAYLNRTRSSQSNTTGTFSVWTKMGNPDADNILFGGHTDVNNRSYIYFSDPTGYGGIFSRTSGSADINFATNALYRDPSAWYHVVVAIDTTQGTESNRFKMYVNGEQITSFSASSYPSQNASLPILNQAAQTVGGGYGSSAVSAMAEGYMADAYYIDGTQYAASDFGETNDNGVWIPKKFTGSFGTNGFKLEFKQTGTGTASASTIGADTSGNDNHLTSNNLAALDVTEDTPTNNFCTLSSVDNDGVVLSEGNCNFDTSSGNNEGVRGTIGVQNGKWYYECKITGSAGMSAGNIGYSRPEVPVTSGPASVLGLFANGSSTFGLYNNSSGKTSLDASAGIGQNDIIGVALDLDSSTKTIAYYRNGSIMGSAQTINASILGDFLLPVMLDDGGVNDVVGSFNFGNPTFSISSGNADANGYGNFEYAPPSGYYSLCTKNLAEFG
jgi:hypothetical protein